VGKAIHHSPFKKTFSFVSDVLYNSEELLHSNLMFTTKGWSQPKRQSKEKLLSGFAYKFSG
jgi:hypothetical protein